MQRTLFDDVGEVPGINPSEIDSKLNLLTYSALGFTQQEICLVADLARVRIKLDEGKLGSAAVDPPQRTRSGSLHCKLARRRAGLLPRRPDRTHAVRILHDGVSGMVTIRIAPRSKDHFQVSIESADRLTAESLSKLRELSRHEVSQWVYFDRRLILLDLSTKRNPRLIEAGKLENPLVLANNRGTSPPRPFAARRFSSERQCPPPVEPTQAENPPPDREQARRRTPPADDGRLQHPLRDRRADPGHRTRRHRGHPPPGPEARAGRRHRPGPPPAQAAPAVPRERPRPEHRLQPPGRRQPPGAPRGPAQRRGLPRRPRGTNASPTRPPPGTSAAGSPRPMSSG